jgi:1-deoxy-D-xylulose-5-phosphate synthase
VVRIGWPDQFIEHGKQDALRAKYGVSVEAALTKLRPLLAAQPLIGEATVRRPMPDRSV